MSKLDDLRDRGFNVIPLKEKSKEPISGMSWVKYQNEKYEGTYPINCNYAVICGKTSGNLFVVDLDDASLYDEIPNELKQTYTTETGKGYHLYFHWVGFPVPNKKFDDKRGRHIDIKSQGGYVLGHGSIHPSGKDYALFNDVPIKKVEYKTVINALKEIGFNVETKPIDEIKNGMEEGGRNDGGFKLACHLIREGLYDSALKFEMEKWNNKNKPPLPESELELIISQAEKAEVRAKVKHIKDARSVLDKLRNKPERIAMQDITPLYEGKRIEFDCMITAVGERQTYTKRANFRCPVCDKEKTVVCDDLYQIGIPLCHDDNRKMICDMDTMETAYIQKLRIQEFLEEAKKATPVEFDAIITDEAVGEAFIGDRKTIVSKFRSIPRDKGYNLIIHQILEMKDMEQEEGCMPTPDELKEWKDSGNIFDRVTASIAPDLYIDPLIIQSLILWASGGNTLNEKRDLIHGALIGDAQLGKSELAKKMHEYLIGSGLTVGRNASGAGLTIGMVKLYDGTSVPKAGWFPQHTGHHCIMDEGDKLKPQDHDSCLEVMEQGTTTLTKNGVPSLTLPTKCPFLFLGNPKNGKFNPNYTHIMDNFEMETPFISRFDFIWCMVDENNPEVDKKIRKFIRSFKDRKGNYMKKEELQRYFNYIQSLKAEIPEHIKDMIDELHAKIRRFNTGSGLPIGNRQYHGIYRLVTACATANLREVVIEEDVKIVEEILRACYKTMKMDLDTGEVKDNMKTTKQSNSEIIDETISQCIDPIFDNTLDKSVLISKLELRGISRADQIVETLIKTEKIYLDDDLQRYRKK